VFERMAHRGTIKEDDFRVLYRSAPFPTSSFAYAHDLEPKLRDKLVGCFINFKYTPEMVKAFDGDTHFTPATFLKEYAVVREVAEAGGEKFTREAYDKEAAKAKK